MASVKEIKTKIASIENTQKITAAMEMVAASKMKKTQEKMFSSRPYAETIVRVINHLSKSSTADNHPFLTQKEEIKEVGILVISTNRGLCGGLNINLFKKIVKEIERFDQQNKKVSLGIVGSKAVSFFNRFHLPVIAQTLDIGDNPQLSDFLGTVNLMLNDYREGKIDEIYLAYNKFINTMSQTPLVVKLLPADNTMLALNEEEAQKNTLVDYVYEPDSTVLLDKLLVRYVESLIYQAILENVASEQAARMVAMKAATDNASNLIADLKLVYNKVRQTSITNELNEIVAGAAAI